MAEEKKYLDKTGLSNLVGKIKTELSKKANAEEVQPKGEYATLVDGTVPSSQLPSYVDDVVEFNGIIETASVKAMSTTKTSKDLLCRVVYVKSSNKFALHDGKEYYGNWGDGNTWGIAVADGDVALTGNVGRQPESGKIYVNIVTGKTYRWSGSSLVEISASLALGETEETAFAGNRGVAVENSLAEVKTELSKKANAEEVKELHNDVKVNTTLLESKSVTSISTKMVGDVLNITATKINGDEATAYVRPATIGTTGLMSASDKNKLDNTIYEEEKRQIAEQSRVSTEQSRATAEQSRADAEKARVAAENSRVSAETKRENDFTAKVAEVDTAVKNCNTATQGAEKVDATITDANVLQVTDRNGAQKALDLAAVAKANGVAEDVETLKKTVATFVDQDGYIGMARMNGDASGDAETTYGTAEKIHEMGAKFRLCTVKNGVITHRCAPGRLTLDENGEEVKIDGTDGDVMLCVEDGLNLLKATKEIDGREMNIIGIGDRKSVWYGVQSKEIPPFGITPCETVNAKILDDVRSQAHCVYNTSVNGSYDDGKKYGIFKDTYKKSGGGYFSKQFSSVANIQYAQRKNEDELTCKPYLGLHFEFYECLITMMFSEIGSLCHTDLNMFGLGITNNAMGTSYYNDVAISGVSGWKLITADGTEKYLNLWDKVFVSGQTSSVELVKGVVGNGWYDMVEILEPQRVLDAIQRVGLVNKIGSKTNIFHYDENGYMVCTSDGSVNLDTGEGMEVCKHYFIVRNVPKCEGMADGVMTAVVNSYTKFECCDGITLSDKTTDMTGGMAILKMSLPVYRGWTLPYTGVFRHLNYGYYVIRVDSEGVINIEYDAIEVKDVKPLKEFSVAAYEASGKDSTVPMLEGVSKVYRVGSGSAFNGEFWTLKSNYSMGLFCVKQWGGNMRTHENAYLWLYPKNNHGNNSVQVHGSVSGCVADVGQASVRSAACDVYAGRGSDSFAGAFAVQL